jgi:Asp-tRNA(Asn)/Glu-tRNA(Gln) amidotransferase A subunit family amidase
VTRETVILGVEKYFNGGDFNNDPARRVAIKTNGRYPKCKPDLYAYLNDEITPFLYEIGSSCGTFPNLVDYRGPFGIQIVVSNGTDRFVLQFAHTHEGYLVSNVDQARPAPDIISSSKMRN